MTHEELQKTGLELTWDVDNEHCAYNNSCGYHVSNFCGIILLRGPLCGSSRHESMEEAKEYAELDALARYFKEFHK